MESQDADGLNGLIHPEKNTSISPVQLRQFENSTITVNAMRVKDISDESAIVRVDTTVRREPAITPTTNLLEVRTHDGEWYVWGEPEGFAPTGLSPDAVIKTFWESINDGDFTLANSLVHPDSPEGKISVRAEPEWNKRTIIVDRVETVEQTEERAIVDIEMTWSMETEEGVQETTVDTSYELRSIDGEWRLWSQQTD